MYFDVNRPIRVVMFGKITQDSGFWHKGRNLSTHLLVYCTEGDFSMRVTDKTFPVRSGNILLIPAGTAYRPLDSDGCTYYFVHFFADCPSAPPKKTAPVKIAEQPAEPGIKGYKYIYQQSADSIITVPLLTENRCSGQIYGIFERMAGLLPFNSAAENLLIDALMRELLIILSAEFVQRDYSNRNLRDMVNFIQVNYARPLTLSILAKTFYLSDSYVARVFRNELHCTVSEYLHSVRLGHARSLLIGTDLSVADIAESIGYGSAYYFSRIFRKVHGTSPTAFRHVHIDV